MNVVDLSTTCPPATVELFWISDFDPNSTGDVFHFTNYRDCTWHGIPFIGLPCTATGFDFDGTRFPSPRLTVANYQGLISPLVYTYQSLVGAKLTRIMTTENYLDVPTNILENPTISNWTIEQKIRDTVEEIEWELSFGGLEGIQLPRRRFLANYCDARYRGDRCGYTGGAVAKRDNSPTTNLAEDDCGKTVTSCKLRNNTRNYAGVPGSKF